MPPRTGPRAKRRPKIGAPRHFVLVFDDGINDLVIAHRLELADGYLMLRDQNDAINRIIARGEWREIRPATIGDIPYSEDADRIDSMHREEATLTPPAEHRPDYPTPPRIVEVDTAMAPIREEEARFVPSSPEEAQRILMEIERRLAPDYQDPPEDAPPTPLPIAPRKD